LYKKRCNVCGEVKPVDEFHVSGRHKDGRYGTCKVCRNVSAAIYRNTHREELLAKRAAYFEKNKERILAKRAAYYDKNREQLRAKARAYGRDHRDERAVYRQAHKEHDAAYREANRESKREKDRAYYKAHREQILAYQRSYRKDHPKKVAARHKAWRESENGRKGALADALNRRAAVDERITSEVVDEVTAEYGGLCPYCNQPIVNGHIDHIVPISMGGTSDRENLVYSCAPCNLSKGDKSLLEFMIHRRLTAK